MVGACTLLLALEIGKNSSRMMIDAKIDDLYQEFADQLSNIRVLATFLSYVEKFCTGRDIEHLSIISVPDYPAWLTDFLALAGFQRCECLTPVDVEDGYRLCLKLGKSNQDAAKDPGAIPKTNIWGLKESIATADPTTNVPPRATIAESSVSAGKLPLKASNQDQATQWLSRNHQILEPANEPAIKNPPANSSTPAQTKPLKENATNTDTPADETDGQVGEKRKRSQTSGDQITEAIERSSRRRWSQNENEGVEPNKKGGNKEEQRLQLNTQPNHKPSQRPTNNLDLAADNAPSSSKVKASSEKRADDSNDITAALLAQVDNTEPAISPDRIKKEPVRRATSQKPSGFSAFRSSPPSPDRPFHGSYNPGPKRFTCFYWATQGSCKFNDYECMHAHFHTGEVARAPRSAKYGRNPNPFPPSLDYERENELSIKGSGDYPRAANESKSTPTGPKALLDTDPTALRPWDGYDSYRP